jgi:membrane fusion protein (multidrug efflux system)
MVKPSLPRLRLLFLALGVVVAVAGGVIAFQRQGGKPAQALAAPDSIAAGDSVAAVRADAKGKKHGKKNEKKEEPPVPVEIAIASPRDIPAYFHATGSLEARRQVELIGKAAGQIVTLNVEEGNYVKEGQVLLEIEHREDEILVEQTAVKAQTADKERERIEGLVAKGLGSDKDLETAREAAKVADLDHHLAQVRLDEKVVRAPFSGQITRREVELGQTVTVGQPLVEIADSSPLEVRLYLPEKIVADLKTGQPVEIRSDMRPDAPLAGKVERIAPAVDPATSTVKVTLTVAGAGEATRVGSFIRARITTDVHHGVTAVPKKALVPEAGITYLFVAEGDSVRKVPVTTGYDDDTFVEVVSGVTDGDRVVSVGQGGLRTGSRIKALDSGTEAAAAKPETTDTAQASDRRR